MSDVIKGRGVMLNDNANFSAVLLALVADEFTIKSYERVVPWNKMNLQK